MASALLRESDVSRPSGGRNSYRAPIEEPRSFGRLDENMGENSTSRKVKDPAFSRRFNQACDTHPRCPELNFGRLTWVRNQLKMMFGDDVSLESVRKWSQGEARPRGDKLVHLAELLQVAPEWLAFGSEGALAPRERRVRNAMADGAVNIVAGAIQIAGGVPAFPEPDDRRAEEDRIDIYATIKGALYPIHVTVGEQDGDEIRFSLPQSFARTFVVGLVQTAPMCFDALELPADIVEANGLHRGSHTELAVTRHGGEYRAGEIKLPRIRSFSERL